MAARFGLFAALIFFGKSLTPEPRAWFVAWNVGQGQWTTIVDSAGCWHFDAGGEKISQVTLMSLCRQRKNFVSLSHWDWDHIGFTGRLVRMLPENCLLIRPLGESLSKRKQNLLSQAQPCRASVQKPKHWSPNAEITKSSNNLSHVFLMYSVLIPGDSPSSAEKTWVAQMPLTHVRVLVLGHHGSRTSTSKVLLNALPSLRLALVSARFKRYGHPHQKTKAELRARRIPLLQTEDWGDIALEL